MTESLWRNIFGFLCRQLCLEFGGNSVTPSEVPETAQIQIFVLGMSSYQEFRWTFLGLGGSQFLLLQKIQINFFWVSKNKVVT